MRRVRDPLLRLAYRVGYHVLRAWSLVSRGTKRGVKCVLVRGGEVLLVRHTYGDDRRWELPGGGVKHGERPLEAARREVREELGIDVPAWTALGDLFQRIDGKRDRLFCFSAEIGDWELELDHAEIAEAEWFPSDRLPPDSARYVARITALAPLPGSP